MVMVKTCTCENCGRSSERVEIEQLSIRGHIADLCLTCAHLLSQSHNHDSFFSIVRNKTADQSNSEMKKVHTLLSTFLLVGMFFIVVVVALGVSQNLDTFPGTAIPTDDVKQQSEYISLYLQYQLK